MGVESFLPWDLPSNCLMDTFIGWVSERLVFCVPKESRSPSSLDFTRSVPGLRGIPDRFAVKLSILRDRLFLRDLLPNIFNSTPYLSGGANRTDHFYFEPVQKIDYPKQYFQPSCESINEEGIT